MQIKFRFLSSVSLPLPFPASPPCLYIFRSLFLFSSPSHVRTPLHVALHFNCISVRGPFCMLKPTASPLRVERHGRVARGATVGGEKTGRTRKGGSLCAVDAAGASSRRPANLVHGDDPPRSLSRARARPLSTVFPIGIRSYRRTFVLPCPLYISRPSGLPC